MSWMIPEHRLDPDQSAFLGQLSTDGNQNYWVKGFAGSGKSVLALWSVVRLRRDNPNLKVCVVLYTHSLIDLFKTGIPDELSNVPVITFHQFKRSPQHYDLIVVDEVQDLPADVVMLLRTYSNRLILAGDEAQSIYEGRVASDEIPALADARPYSLTVLHRLTARLIEIANSIFPDKRLHEAKHSRLKNVEVMLAVAEDAMEEVKYVWHKAVASAVPGVPAAVLLPNRGEVLSFVNRVLITEGHSPWQVTNDQYGKPDFGAMNKYLLSQGLKLQYVGSKYGSLREAETSGMVVLTTYHSSKGLDFETVFLPFLSSGCSIWRDDPDREKTLLFVALTRSRLNLFISYTGSPHHLVARIPTHLLRRIEIPEASAVASGGKNDDVEILF